MKLSGFSIIRQRKVNAYHSSLPDLTDLTVLSDFGQKGAVVAHSGQVMSYCIVLTNMSFIYMFLSQEAAERRIAHNNGWNGIKHLQTMCLMYLIQFH